MRYGVRNKEKRERWREKERGKQETVVVVRGAGGSLHYFTYLPLQKNLSSK